MRAPSNRLWLLMMLIGSIWICGTRAGAQPAGVDQKTSDAATQCKRVFIEAIEAMISSPDRVRSHFALPSGDQLKQFDALMKSMAATKRLEDAAGKVNPKETRDAALKAKEEFTGHIRDAVSRGSVVVEGDTAKLKYTIVSPSAASGDSTVTRRLVRSNGKWLVDAAEFLSLDGSEKIIEFLGEQTEATEAATREVESGREKPPIVPALLVQKQMTLRALEKGFKEGSKETPAATNKPRPTVGGRPPVDGEPAPGELRRIQAEGRVRCMVFPNAYTVAAGSTHTPESLSLWNLATGKRLRTFKEAGKEFHVTSLAVTKDGKRLAAGGYAMDVEEIARARREHPDRSPYEQVKPEAGVRIWDTTTGKLLRSISTGDGIVLAVHISPDDGLVAAGDSSGRVTVCEVATGKVIHSVTPSRVGLSIGGVEFSPVGSELAVGEAQADHESIIVLSTRDWTQKRSVDIDRPLGLVRYMPDKASLAGARPGAVAVYGPAGVPTKAFFCMSDHTQPGRINDLRFSGDGRWAVVSEGIEHDKRELVSLFFSVTPCVRVFDVASTEQVAQLNGHADAVWCAAFAPDNKSIMTGSADGTIRVWQLPKSLTERPATAPVPSPAPRQSGSP